MLAKQAYRREAKEALLKLAIADYPNANEQYRDELATSFKIASGDDILIQGEDNATEKLKSILAGK